MQVRYVQDARKRPVDLRKMLGPDEGVSLDVCARFEDLSSVADAPFDVLLIDARRADRVALEEDIRTARKYTDAPIVFLTGTESGQIRARGLEAGAEAVLTRRSLTSHLIKEVVERARRRLGSSHIERPAPTSDVSGSKPCNGAREAALMAALGYVEQGLARLDLAANTDVPATGGASAADLLTIIGYARRLVGRSDRASRECDGAALLAEMQDDLLDAAAEAGAALLIEAPQAAKFFVIGSAEDARSGLEAIVVGLLRACPQGSRLHVSLGAEGDETRLRAKGDAPLVRDHRAFFTPDEKARDADYATTSLRCGAALLGLRPEQVDLSEATRGVVVICL